MILKFVKLVAYDKIRYLGKCPHCKKDLLLDREVFQLDTKTVECYQCKTTYLVVNIINRSNFSLDVQKK